MRHITLNGLIECAAESASFDYSFRLQLAGVAFPSLLCVSTHVPYQHTLVHTREAANPARKWSGARVGRVMIEQRLAL